MSESRRVSFMPNMYPLFLQRRQNTSKPKMQITTSPPVTPARASHMVLIIIFCGARAVDATDVGDAVGGAVEGSVENQLGDDVGDGVNNDDVRGDDDNNKISSTL
jgi:hypothetical protein